MAKKRLTQKQRAAWRKAQKARAKVLIPEFYRSIEWKRLRYDALVKYGNRCQCCGASPKDGVRLNVDHIKPRRKFPSLALDIANLQVLCAGCNAGKGNRDEDWREPVQTADVISMSFERWHYGT